MTFHIVGIPSAHARFELIHILSFAGLVPEIALNGISQTLLESLFMGIFFSVCYVLKK